MAMLSRTHAAVAEAKGPLLTAFLAALPGDPAEPPPGAGEFLAAIADDYRAEELPGVSLADLGARAAGLWAFAQTQGGEAPAIRVSPARGRDGAELGAELVEIVQPDAPFLVDSVMAALIDAGATLLAMFHPLIVADSGPVRSAIQAWIEPLGEDQAPRLIAGLTATLDDVRL